MGKKISHRFSISMTQYQKCVVFDRNATFIKLIKVLALWDLKNCLPQLKINLTSITVAKFFNSYEIRP